MYSVKTKTRGHLSEAKVDTLEKAYRLALITIQKSEVQKVEIWLGGLFHGSLTKEGNWK